MRILLTLTLASSLVLAAAAAGAADLPQSSASTASYQDKSPTLDGGGITTLTASPMFLEIKQVLADFERREDLLLKELAAATEDRDAERAILRIERLDVDRALAVLKIQAHYARLQENWNLEYKLRVRIMEILERETYAEK